MRVDPALTAMRRAVRADLVDLARGSLVLVACSGGADSLALLVTTCWVAPRLGLRAGAVHVDHRLRADSAEVAERVAELATKLGAEPVVVAAPAPSAARGGPEAVARQRRYAALESVAAAHDAAAVLLAHTREDQAESVLLALARGSGTRSLAGMPARRGRYRRPLLAVPRVTTHAACAAAGLEPDHDPSNSERRFTRNRVRHDVLPALVEALGDRSVAALARTADLARDDADFLDELAGSAAPACRLAPDGSDLVAFDLTALASLPPALRGRVLRAELVAAGVPAGSLSAAHVDRVAALVTRWRGQRAVDLPGGLAASRGHDRLVVRVGHSSGSR